MATMIDQKSSLKYDGEKKYGNIFMIYYLKIL